MIETEGNILVNRSIDEVFAFVSDVGNDPTWDPDLLQVKRLFEGPIHEGATFDVHFKPFLGVSTCAMKVTGYEKNRREVREGRPGLMQAKATFLFEPVESGTRVIRRTQIQPLGVLPQQPVSYRRQEPGETLTGFPPSLLMHFPCHTSVYVDHHIVLY